MGELFWFTSERSTIGANILKRSVERFRKNKRNLHMVFSD